MQNPTDSLDLLRRKNNPAFDKLCEHLKIAQDDENRRNSLLSDLGNIVASHYTSRKINAIRDKNNLEKLLKSIKRLHSAANEIRENSIFEWLCMAKSINHRTLFDFISKIDGLASNHENDFTLMEPYLKGSDPINEVLKLGLRRIFAVYLLDGGCDAASRLKFTRIKNMTNSSGAFIPFARDALNALGIWNSRDEEWTDEAVEKRLKRR